MFKFPAKKADTSHGDTCALLPLDLQHPEGKPGWAWFKKNNFFDGNNF